MKRTNRNGHWEVDWLAVERRPGPRDSAKQKANCNFAATVCSRHMTIAQWIFAYSLPTAGTSSGKQRAWKKSFQATVRRNWSRRLLCIRKVVWPAQLTKAEIPQTTFVYKNTKRICSFKVLTLNVNILHYCDDCSLFSSSQLALLFNSVKYALAWTLVSYLPRTTTTAKLPSTAEQPTNQMMQRRKKLPITSSQGLNASGSGEQMIFLLTVEMFPQNWN